MPLRLFFPAGRNTLCRVLLWLLTVGSARAGMQETLDAIRSSQFRFARAESEVPFLPLGWVQDRYYPNSSFEPEEGNLAGATVAENSFSLGAVLPTYVAERDMLMLGGDVLWDDIAVKSGPYSDQSVMVLTPVAAWLHQFGTDDLVGAFVAPMFSYECHAAETWGYSGYGGLIGMHYFSDQFQLLYGGVYQYSFGKSYGYPYLGVNWLPTPRCSVALVFPWPTVSYALTEDCLLQLAVTPGGSSWAQRENHYETTQSLSSWNLTIGAGYRLHQQFWFFADVGVAGLRGIEIDDGENHQRLESKPGLVFTLAIQFRP